MYQDKPFFFKNGPTKKVLFKQKKYFLYNFITRIWFTCTLTAVTNSGDSPTTWEGRKTCSSPRRRSLWPSVLLTWRPRVIGKQPRELSEDSRKIRQLKSFVIECNKTELNILNKSMIEFSLLSTLSAVTLLDVYNCYQ